MIDNLKLKNEPMSVVNNSDTRVLWNGPKNWLLVSTEKDLFKNISQKVKETDFAVTELSHSKAIIEIEGKEVKEVLKNLKEGDIVEKAKVKAKGQGSILPNQNKEKVETLSQS